MHRQLKWNFDFQNELSNGIQKNYIHYHSKAIIYIYIRGVTVHKMYGSIRQWCHGSVCFRYGGQGNWLRRNVEIFRF